MIIIKSKRRDKGKLGHVVQTGSCVCRKGDSKSSDLVTLLHPASLKTMKNDS